MAADVVDRILEVSVVGSFSRIGPAVRSMTAAWDDPGPLDGRTIVITGATSGLGLAAACQMASLGASLWLVGRDRGRLEAARDRVVSCRQAGAAVESELADLADLEQVASLVGRLSDRLRRIDVLVHDAGALLRRRQVSPQGYEATVAVNLLAPFTLTAGLLPLLKAAGPSRVITMTSGGMYAQRFDISTLEMPPAGYRGAVAYSLAKRAQVVLTHAWQERLGPTGIDFHVVHPGWADTPGLATGLPGFARVMRPLLRSAADGADTLVWLAASRPGPEGGHLWLDRRVRGEHHLLWTWAPAARRQADQDALWDWLQRRTVAFSSAG